MADECCKRSFFASLKDSARRVLENPRPCPLNVREERLAICHECDRYLARTDQCEICQCILTLKASFANQKCPIDKWVEYEN